MSGVPDFLAAGLTDVIVEEGPPAHTRILNVTVDDQKKDVWCWTVVADAIFVAYGDPHREQCTIARANLDENLEVDCCQLETPCACVFEVTELGPILAHHFGGQEFDDDDHRSPDFVVQEIDAGRPIAVRLEYEVGGGHFVIIRGYRNVGGEVAFLSICDPWGGFEVDVPFNDFRLNGFQKKARWHLTIPTTGDAPVPPL